MFYQKAIDNGHSMTKIEYDNMVFCDHCGRRSIADKRLDCNSRADFEPCGPLWDFGSKDSFLANLAIAEEYNKDLDDDEVPIPDDTLEFIELVFVPNLFKEGLKIQKPIMISSYNGYLYLDFRLAPNLHISFSIFSEESVRWHFRQSRYSKSGTDWLDGIKIVHEVFSVCM